MILSWKGKKIYTVETHTVNFHPWKGIGMKKKKTWWMVEREFNNHNNRVENRQTKQKSSNSTKTLKKGTNQSTYLSVSASTRAFFTSHTCTFIHLLYYFLVQFELIIWWFLLNLFKIYVLLQCWKFIVSRIVFKIFWFPVSNPSFHLKIIL
jgi:hypothetical protein